VLARTHERLDSGPPLVHVDAYRLGGPAELDDLDIDFDASIVVVEWAAGMLDGVTEDWLEISIERPTGAASPREAFSGAASPGVEGDELVEPRIVTITGHGARWLDLKLD
jgi:tRNA A37 threonylcarbamoyladenosine biosynthesis protein TsaE